jgi:hypothetical protein
MEVDYHSLLCSVAVGTKMVLLQQMASWMVQFLKQHLASCVLKLL